MAQAVIVQGGRSNSVGSAASATAVFQIPDMDCPACAVGLSASIRRLAGVSDAKVDFASRRAVVSYDPAKLDFTAFEKVVKDAGFHVKPEPRS